MFRSFRGLDVVYDNVCNCQNYFVKLTSDQKLLQREENRCFINFMYKEKPCLFRLSRSVDIWYERIRYILLTCSAGGEFCMWS